MAHLVDSLAWTGRVPWHALGRRLPNHATVEEMIRFGGLNWEVVPRPVFQADADGVGASVPGWKALTRSDRPDVTLSVVKESYGIVQNAEALSLAAAAVGEGTAAAEVCGSLDEGRRIFCVLSCKEAGFDVVGERIDAFLLVYAGHDGYTSVACRFTPVRVVCQNTLTAALSRGSKSEVLIRHTRDAAQRVALAAGLIKDARAYFGTFHERALALVKQRFTLTEAEALSRVLFPDYEGKDGKKIIPANQTKVIQLFARQKETTDHRIAGTRWGYFNAVTALVDHNLRGGTDARRMGRALGGSDIKDKALALLAA